MFILISLISYHVFVNDPPVIVAYSTETLTKSLIDTFEDKKNVNIIRPLTSNLTARISQISQIDIICQGKSKENFYVYQNSTELQQIYDKKGQPGYTVNEVSISDYKEICDKLNGFVIFAEHYPEFKKVGYSNPFTPGVWNCFFFILFTLSFIIWSMIHYANIDVQTRFAKKLY